MKSTLGYNLANYSDSFELTDILCL